MRKNIGKLPHLQHKSDETNPPTFVVFCNDPELMHFSYQRFLINQLRENFDFTGTPIKILPRKRK